MTVYGAQKTVYGAQMTAYGAQKMPFAFRVTRAGIDTDTNNFHLIFALFRSRNGYANAPAYYVIRTVPVVV